MNRIVAAFCLAMAMWLPSQAKAAITCTFDTVDGQAPRLAFPVSWDGSFDPNAYRVGEIFKTLTVTTASFENASGSTVSFVCSYGGSGVVKGTTAAAPTRMYNPATGLYLNVYPTNVPGVGMRIKGGYTEINMLEFPFDFGASREGTFSTDYKVQVDLVKIGPITAGGVLAGEFAGQFIVDGPERMSYRWSGTVPIQPTIPTCVPSIADQPVNLGQIDVSSVTDDGYSNTVDFNMGVVCSGGSSSTVTQQMAVTFTDATDPTNTTDKLKLTPTSTATGVKVQLLQGTQPVTFGAEPTNGMDTPYSRPLGTIQNGTFSFPMKVRYVQTGPVTAGSANAIATFTYTYH